MTGHSRKHRRSPATATEFREVMDALRDAKEAYPSVESRKDKKNFAERFSRNLALVFANRLRKRFPGVLPDASGRQQESRARSSHGYKKLDVNYSTLELGLGLGISIKTINARDAKSKRYTKNYSRADNEFRAESMDYHVRQPYAALVGVLLLPLDACADGGPEADDRGVSSFGAAVRFFRRRAPRSEPTSQPDRFERFFIGLYDESGASTRFVDVSVAPPRRGPPATDRSLDLEDVLAEVIAEFDRRNDPPFEWAPE